MVLLKKINPTDTLTCLLVTQADCLCPYRQRQKTGHMLNTDLADDDDTLLCVFALHLHDLICKGCHAPSTPFLYLLSVSSLSTALQSAISI